MFGSTAKIIEKIADHVNEDKMSFCQKIINFFSKGVESLKKNHVSFTSSDRRNSGLGGRLNQQDSFSSNQLGGDDGKQSPGF